MRTVNACNPGHIKRTIQDKMHETVISKWSEDVQRQNSRTGSGRNKLRTYRHLKHCWGPEPYVTELIPLSDRKALSKFRSGVAPLMIEIGRYNGTPEEERTCPMCDNGVENEYHAVMDCPLYDDLRSDALEAAMKLVPGFLLYSSLNRFYMILSNEELIKVSARLCKLILERRRAFLYNEQ